MLADSCMMLLAMACSSSGTYELPITVAISDELQFPLKFPPTEPSSVQVTSAHEPLTATPVATLGVTATRQPTVQILPLIPAVEATFGDLLPANIVVATPTAIATNVPLLPTPTPMISAVPESAPTILPVSVAWEVEIGNIFFDGET